MSDVFYHRYTPGRGDTVLDVGAGVGREGIVFSRFVGPDGTVHCIEAHPVTFELLRRMCAVNEIDNMHCHHLAVSDRSGKLTINTEEQAELYYRNKLVAGDAEGVAVSAVSLAEFLSEHGIARVDLLAMNIEGAERAAVQGMAPVADRIRNVAIACHDFLADEDGDESMRTKDAVCALLSDQGFSVTGRTDAGPAWRRNFVYGTRG